MAEFIGKLCPCLPLSKVSSRRSARSKVRVLARKRNKNNQGGPMSTSGVEDSVNITRNGSLTIYSISGAVDDPHHDGAARNHSFPGTLREEIDLPGTVQDAEDRQRATKEPAYNMADGTRELSVDALLRLPQPSKAYVSNVRMRRLMKEFKAVTKIAEDAKREDLEKRQQYSTEQSKLELTADSQIEDKTKESPGKNDKLESASKICDTENQSNEKVGRISNQNGCGETEEEAGSSTSTKESCEEKIEKGAKAIDKALSSGGFMTTEKLSGPPYAVELVSDSLAEWNIKLFHINPKSSLAKDMKKHNYQYILFSMSFPENFPFAPPFVRVVSPQIEYGYVLDGGAICMELLTPQGWSSAYTIDAVIMQLGASLVAGDGRIIQSGYRSDVPFNKQEAEVSFRAIVETHDRYGWHKTPGENS